MSQSPALRFGVMFGYWPAQPHPNFVEIAQEAEKLGFDSAWTAEAWGNDAVTTATWVAAQTTKLKVGTAIMQMHARTPAMAAMTATTLNQLSEGRFLLGLGPSGPQVVEGWHGVPYGKPLTRTKEYIEIIRQIWAREKPLEFSGEYYEIPNTGPGRRVSASRSRASCTAIRRSRSIRPR